MFRPLPAIAATLLLASMATGQERCSTRTLTQQWLQAHGRSTDLHQALAKLPQGMRKGGATPTIPVVVHVVYNTTAENVATSVIQNMIATMNQDYQAQNSDWNQVRSTFAADRANPDILFCLAAVDPNGVASTGITRTQTSQTWFDPDNETNDMKSAPDGIDPWDPSSYLNIWICDIASGLGGGLITTGYAYLPVGGMVGSAIDGIVIDYNYGLGAGSRTATHEAGHYLGLDHPWADGGCSSDDGMDDTPVTDEATFSCSNTNLVNCVELVQYENFMDYADCSLMFTNDQAARMNSVVFGVRAGLLNTGACGTIISGPCIPTSAGGTTENDFIDGVQLGSISNLNSGSNTGPAYTDYTSTYTTSLQRGSSYTITITSGDYTPDNYAAWIDYNQNDAFEASEKLGEFTNTTIGEASSFTFTVPAGATAGGTVMRVRGVYFNTGEPTTFDPCYAYSYGETEDYGITITVPGGGPCIPTSTTGTADGDFVDGVVLNTINNTGSGSVTGPTYHDYTSQTTALTRGVTYVATITSGSYNEDLMGAWIDFNANDVFDTNELLGDWVTSSTYEQHDFEFTVPNTATLGSTILRARVVYPDNGQPTTIDACTDFAWGETEDYGIVIQTSTGIAREEPTTVSIYPVPADNTLSISWTGARPALAEVVDLTGRVIMTVASIGTTSSMDVSSLSNGRYVLRTTTNGRVIAAPFCVLHGQ